MLSVGARVIISHVCATPGMNAQYTLIPFPSLNQQGVGLADVLAPSLTTCKIKGGWVEERFHRSLTSMSPGLSTLPASYLWGKADVFVLL